MIKNKFNNLFPHISYLKCVIYKFLIDSMHYALFIIYPIELKISKSQSCAHGICQHKVYHKMMIDYKLHHISYVCYFPIANTSSSYWVLVAGVSHWGI